MSPSDQTPTALQEVVDGHDTDRHRRFIPARGPPGTDLQRSTRNHRTDCPAVDFIS